MTAWHDPRRLTGMAAPLTMWALHFVVVYSLQGVACAEGLFRRALAGQPLVFWLWLLLTGVALAGIAWLGLRAWRCHRKTTPSDAAAAGQREARFASRLTLLVSAMAFVAVVFTVIPVFMLPVCG